MIKKSKIAVVAIIVLFVFIGSSRAEKPSEWISIYEKDGIHGFQRTYPGSDIHEFRAVALIDAKIEVVGQVLRDISRYPLWVADCKEAEVIRDIDYYRKVVRIVTCTPWPIKDRVVYVQNDMVFDDENARCVIRFKGTDEPERPEDEDLVRVPFLTGSYLLEYIGRHKTRVSFSQRADSGGDLPRGLANWRARWHPFQDLEGLRQMVTDPVYEKRARTTADAKKVERMIKDKAAVERILKNRLAGYFDNAKVADLIFSDPQAVERICAGGVTYDAILAEIKNGLKIVFESPDPGKWLNDPELAHMLAARPDLGQKLLKDDQIVALMLMGENSLEEVLAQRIQAILECRP